MYGPTVVSVLPPTLPALRVPGTQVNAQVWGRDSLATGSFLSDGLEFLMN